VAKFSHSPGSSLRCSSANDRSNLTTTGSSQELAAIAQQAAAQVNALRDLVVHFKINGDTSSTAGRLAPPSDDLWDVGWDLEPALPVQSSERGVIAG